MRTTRIALFLLFCVPLVSTAGEANWTSKRLLSDFHAEGAAVGDLDGDGDVDIAYGPFWFAGPEFSDRKRFAEGEPFVADQGYSDNFFSFIHDIDGDGHNDVVVFGFPGKEVRLYLNPGPEKIDDRWPMHRIVDELGHESPHFVDLVPGGLPEIVGSRGTSYGFYAAGSDPARPWEWHAVSPENEAGGRFEHGMGVGDINGNGRLDIVQRMFWYEQPESGGGAFWKKHRWSPLPLPGGAQILVDDLDGDGDSDLVTSLKAHGYGLAWFEQTEPGKFTRHDLMGESSTDNPHGVCFSQLHALALADIDGDGRNDFVTGKRHLAHQGKDPGGLQAPVLYWFRNTETAEGIDFVPHFVDDASGVGVEVAVADLDGDGKPDIVSGNKKGLAVHLQNPGASPSAVERWKVSGGRPQNDYGSGLSPEEALARIEVPDGFSVDLIAAEPDVTQPIAMCFDARGRLWVVEGHTYPVPAPEGEGKDRILIFEDGDGDGSLETRKVFAEGINLASGIEVGFGGVFVGAAPHLLFFPDKDQNDEPDGEPEVLLDGWGTQDTHETLNAFTWGPDGWLYGCHGVFTHSVVGKPGTPEEDRVKINAGVWRYHPIDGDFEVYAHGTSNPWGVDFNEHGDWFASACVIPHFYHLSQGGRYQRQAGQHFNPWTFADIQTIADHEHYAGSIRDHAFWGANREDRPPSPTDTSALGGGHAHCGLAIYQADVFPPEYRGEAFFHNLHGHRILRERLESDGSGYTARHRPDFALANNHDHIGVGVAQGPDGALYYSDWVDPQTCHHRDVEIWDRSNGRIFRVRYGDTASPSIDLPGNSDAELVGLLGHGNAFQARQAQRLLQERAHDGTLDTQETTAALEVLEKETTPDNAPVLLRLLWTRHVCGLLEAERFPDYLDASSEHVRGWAVQFLGPKKEALPADALAELERLAEDDSSLVVRRYLASKLQRLPLEQRWTIAENLIGHLRSGHDRNIPLLCWYGIEPLVEADAPRALDLVNRTAWPRLKEFITRRAAVMTEGRSAITTSLSRTKNPGEFLHRAETLLAALKELPPVDEPEGWNAAKTHANTLAEKEPAVADVLARLGARFGDSEFFPLWRSTARDDTQKMPNRIEALEILTAGRDPELGTLARELLDVPALQPASLSALRRHPGEATAKALVEQLDDFPLKRREAVNLLASRPEMALVMLEAVDRDEVDPSLISTALLDQFERFENEKINAIIDRNWTRGASGIDLSELAAAVENWKKKLNPKVMAKADALRGRQIFATSCGTCHELFGEGVALGPDLTGSNRADLGYLLENILAPSAVVGRDYLLNVVTLQDGSVVSGMLKRDTPDFVEVAMPGGSVVTVETEEIASREELAQSLMPAGLLEAMPLDQAADLVKYLGSSPGSSPGTASTTGTDSAVAPPADGVVRIEGESLLADATASGGNFREQNLTRNGPGWSGGKHLWWMDGKPGDTLTLKLKGLEPGTRNLTLFPTTAKDYARIKVMINGHQQEADLYTAKVLPGDPVEFEKINVSPGEPLSVTIQITGKNEAAIPRHMVGVDRIEIEKAE
ncbi:MAG: PVC-type heme-binding CxxCH protein [Verrucomicrobiales bacterium]